MGKLEDKVLLGISFDGIRMSGITEEFKKLSEIFDKSGYKILLDLGYDITPTKKNFFKPYTDEQSEYPEFIELVRMPELVKIEGYTHEFVNQIKHDIVIADDRNPENPLRHKMKKITLELSQIFYNFFHEKRVSFLVIENGTLPNNVMYSEALYQTIERYGDEKGFGKYVLWRDHDFMWNCKTVSWGKFPFPNIPRMRESSYIQYVAHHDHSISLANDWCSNVEIKPLPNSFLIPELNTETPFPLGDDMDVRNNFRSHYGIPEDSILICKTTRMVPVKRTDREIELVKQLNLLLEDEGKETRAYLAITGNPDEHSQESDRLKDKVSKSGIGNYVVFTGLLRSFSDKRRGNVDDEGYSIRDLIASSDFVSFMTSYDYESFGNPVLESCIVGIPYISTSYELYNTVYGRNGFRGLVLKVDKKTDVDTLPDRNFARKVLHQYRESSKIKTRRIRNNYDSARRHYSIDTLKANLGNMFPEILVHAFDAMDQGFSSIDAIVNRIDIDKESIPEIYLIIGTSRGGTSAMARSFAGQFPTYYQFIKAILESTDKTYGKQDRIDLTLVSERIGLKETFGAWNIPASTFDPVEILLKAGIPKDKIHVLALLRDPLHTYNSWKKKYNDTNLNIFLKAYQNVIDVSDKAEDEGIDVYRLVYASLENQEAKVSKSILRWMGLPYNNRFVDWKEGFEIENLIFPAERAHPIYDQIIKGVNKQKCLSFRSGSDSNLPDSEIERIKTELVSSRLSFEEFKRKESYTPVGRSGGI